MFRHFRAVLGAFDPEMTEIRAILDAAGIPWDQACVEGAPVHPGNAYQHDLIEWPDTSDCWVVLAIECAIPPDIDPSRVVRFDHHNPGDPGYDAPPKAFWKGASLGQLHRYLAGARLIAREPTQQQLMAAAADHCLVAAYQGRCPGVDPDSLMRWRAETRARFQNRDVGTLLATINDTREQLRAIGTDENGVVDLVSATSEGTLPECPEAAAREGVAFMARVRDKGGEKIVLMGHQEPQYITDWMEHERAQGRNVYGNPHRGFAGVYLG